MQRNKLMNRYVIPCLLPLLMVGVHVAAASASALDNHAMPATMAGTKASALLTSAPLDFVVNRGQWDPSVKFAARNREMAASFGARDITLRLGAERATSLALSFEHASPHSEVIGEEIRTGH